MSGAQELLATPTVWTAFQVLFKLSDIPESHEMKTATTRTSFGGFPWSSKLAERSTGVPIYFLNCITIMRGSSCSSTSSFLSFRAAASASSFYRPSKPPFATRSQTLKLGWKNWTGLQHVRQLVCKIHNLSRVSEQISKEIYSTQQNKTCSTHPKVLTDAVCRQLRHITWVNTCVNRADHPPLYQDPAMPRTTVT